MGDLIDGLRRAAEFFDAVKAAFHRRDIGWFFGQIRWFFVWYWWYASPRQKLIIGVLFGILLFALYALSSRVREMVNGTVKMVIRNWYIVVPAAIAIYWIVTFGVPVWVYRIIRWIRSF